MIFNKTRKQPIIDEESICRSFISKATGLMFRKKPDYGLVFLFDKARKVSLTMYFVFFPIDVLFLDQQMRVVDMKKDFRPFTNYTPIADCNIVVELPTGLLGKTKIGDSIAITGLK